MQHENNIVFWSNIDQINDILAYPSSFMLPFFLLINRSIKQTSMFYLELFLK